MTKLTPTVKRQLIRDWQALAPQFAIFEPMRIGRRVGPLVQGICLDRDSSNAAYLPTLHVHCLCQPFPSISLELRQPLLTRRSGTVERISVQFHEVHYREARERLLASSLLPVEGDWRLSEVIHAYEKYQQFDFADPYPTLRMRDAVSICAWLDEGERASALVARYVEEAAGWPGRILQRHGGISGWEDSLAALARSGDELRATVLEQIDSHRLQGLPVSDLLP
jgi:hypothetical protein